MTWTTDQPGMRRGSWTLEDPGLPPLRPGYVHPPWPPPEYAGRTEAEQMILTRTSLLAMGGCDEARLLAEIRLLATEPEVAVRRLCR